MAYAVAGLRGGGEGGAGVGYAGAGTAAFELDLRCCGRRLWVHRRTTIHRGMEEGLETRIETSATTNCLRTERSGAKSMGGVRDTSLASPQCHHVYKGLCNGSTPGLR